MRAKVFMFLALAGLLFVSRTALAITGYDPSVDASEDMEHDTDAYTPTDTDPLGDPALAGDTPGAGPGHLGGGPFVPPNDMIAGQDWFDIRNGGVGVIEEVPAGFAGVPGTGAGSSYLGHVPAPHSDAHLAILQFEGGDGPFGRTNRQSTAKPVPTLGGYVGGRTGYWATQDLYLDPAVPYGGPDGIPDFWWTNAVNRSDTGTYFTEAGMTGTVSATPGFWDIHTTSGVFMGSLPVGTWVGMEIEPKMSATIAGGVDFEYRLYAAGGSHTGLVSVITLPEYTGTVGGFGLLTGPRYNWYTFPGPNVSHIFVDNVGWASLVPEPSSLVLAGLGALGLVYAARRRRKA